MKRNKWILMLILALISNRIKAEIKLPTFFGDHMVLQQKSLVKIWGKSERNSNVAINPEWGNNQYETISDSLGNWMLKLKTPEAGGPYSMTISDGSELQLSDVMIGEVWICSGQSNMVMPMRGILNQPVKGSLEAIATSKNSKIRLFTAERNWSLTKLDDLKGSWKTCEPSSVAEFSAVAYYFGKMLNKVLDVPIGLLCVSRGGSVIEAWMSENNLKEYDWVSIPNEIKKGEKPQKRATTGYVHLSVSLF